MQRVVSRDKAAFQMLMERHAARMLSLAYHTLRNTAQAQDVVQEAFVRLWLKAASFDASRAKMTTWMHQIVVNLCVDEFRQEGRRVDSLTNEPMAAWAVDRAVSWADDAPDALGSALAIERRQQLHQAMRCLPVRQRAALTLFHIQELSGRDSAHIMQLSESAFESLLGRARHALKQQLSEYING